MSNRTKIPLVQYVDKAISLHKNNPKFLKNADTVLVDPTGIMETTTYSLTERQKNRGLSCLILYRNTKSKNTFIDMFKLFTGMDFKKYVMQCIEVMKEEIKNESE